MREDPGVPLALEVVQVGVGPIGNVCEEGWGVEKCNPWPKR